MLKYILLSGLLLTACGPLDGLTGLENKASDSAKTESTSDTKVSLGANLDADLAESLPSPEEIASFTGMSASACSEEGSLKSQTGPATTVDFKNSSDAGVIIYWLNMSGKRVEYKKLSAGASYTQHTFVTHPWLIANLQDQCMGIYTSDSTSNVVLDIKQNVSLDVSAGATGELSTLTQENVSEARVRQGLACLNAKGDKTEALAVQGLLNVYLQMKLTLGEQLAAQGYLSATVATLNAKGC